MRTRIAYWAEGSKALHLLIKELGIDYLDTKRLRMVVSNSRTDAYARIWGLQRVFQEAYNLKPMYVIEAIWPRFFNASCEKKLDVIIHELAHVPESFSGGLRPHSPKFRRIYTELQNRLQKFVKFKNKLIPLLCKLLSSLPEGFNIEE